MSDREHFSTTEAAFEAVEPYIREEESMSEFFERIAPILEDHLDNSTQPDHAPETAPPLTRDDVDDIVSQTASQAADELEERLRTR